MALLIGLLINCFTWPVFQIVRDSVGDHWIPVLELVIVIIEAVGFRLLLKSRVSKAFAVSLLANLLSYGLGFFVK